MARRRKARLIEASHYKWRFSLRAGVWHADGRSNSPPLARYSLGTRDEAEARTRLAELDLKCAIERGRADASLLRQFDGRPLPIADGRRLYDEFQSRPPVAGGIRKKSQQRYKAVFDKFEAFASRNGIATWEAVSGRVIEKYLSFLQREKYSQRTQYLEGTLLKQTLGWLRKSGHLLAPVEVDLKLKKPRGSNRHCWTMEEFRLLVAFCQGRTELRWLADVVMTLGLTGVRISELVNLRWGDVDLKECVIRLVDESSTHSTDDDRERRTLKSGKDRSFPVHDLLRPVFQRIKPLPDGYVFHGPLGGRLKPDTVRNILIRDVLKPIAASSPDQISPRFAEGRLHSFRHFFCS